MGRYLMPFAAYRRAQGFSLIELLLVVFVIAMITSMVSLNVGSGGENVRLETTVRSLADTARYALDEAQFSGRDYGLRVERNPGADGMVFVARWQERFVDGWAAPASGKEVFAPLELSPDIELELEIENAPFAEVDIDEEQENRGPQIVFYASGETTVGAINLRRRDSGELLWRIEWDLLGRFDVLRRGIADEDE